MDISFTAEELAFRDEVRQFLSDNLSPELARKVANSEHLTKAEMEGWHAVLNRRGWLANHWPKAHGGPGWTAVQKYLFENECAMAHAPRIVPFGVSMLGPVLIKYGTEAQKAHWLPRILNGDDWWCQGYSEPGAGSDLAGLKTSAVRDGDHYVVNGQKTWTTLGQHANMMFTLVRTDPSAKKQAGISFLLIDMTTPGIEVRFSASTTMWPCLSTAISGDVEAMSGFDSLPMATMTLSTSSVNSLPGISCILPSTHSTRTQSRPVTCPSLPATRLVRIAQSRSTPSSWLVEVRSLSGQSGQVSSLFSFSGGCGMISIWVTEAAPWRFDPVYWDEVLPAPRADR